MRICKDNFIGKEFLTNNNGSCFIIDYDNELNVTVIFHKTLFIKNSTMKQLKRGAVRDPFHPNSRKLGVGVVDVRAVKDGVRDLEFKYWSSMIERCYSPSYHNAQPTYADCCVEGEWLIYSIFKKDVQDMIGFGQEGWHLDKDILLKGNKKYSKDTCCFVPREINSFFNVKRISRGDFPVGVSLKKETGKFVSHISIDSNRISLGTYMTPEEAFYAYKKAKEGYAKELAYKWKDQIDPRAFEALINYEVDINE
ncbi:HNH family homing endonuclease [Acinetobacter phage BS46]|nr:HNH family homing endonuclease [Acinetobacter phage BS46]